MPTPLSKQIEIGDIVRRKGTGDNGSLWMVEQISGDPERCFGTGVTPGIFPEPFSALTTQLEAVIDGRMLRVLTREVSATADYDAMIGMYMRECADHGSSPYFGINGYGGKSNY